MIVDNTAGSYSVDDIRMAGAGLSTATTFAYNTANELTSMTDNNGTTTFTYDDWGRTVTKSLGGDHTVYSYLYGGRLVHVDLPGTEVAYDYNGAGQRVSRTWSNDEIQRNYYWNGYSVVNEYLDDDNATYYDWERSYVGGLAERAYSGGAYAYYFTDHLGTTLALYDESKDRTGGIDYSPYGTATVADGAAGGTTRRYTGHDYDPLTGDYFAPYRYYSPSTHRWLTRDPLGMVDGPNVYAYVGGNPISLRDALGLCPERDRCKKDEQDKHLRNIDMIELAWLNCVAYGTIACFGRCSLKCGVTILLTPAAYLACVAKCTLLCGVAATMLCSGVAGQAMRIENQRHKLRMDKCDEINCDEECG